MVPEAELEPADAAALVDAITYHVFANSHILVYPIPGLDGSVEPGRRLINYVWYRNYLAGDDLDDVLTDVDGERRELSLPPGIARADHVAEVRATAEARLPRLLADVVTGVEQPFLQVIYDVAVPRMAFGRTCLIGDAAWVVRPHAAAGTAKAAADGWALVDALTHNDSVPEALVAFEREQMELGRQLLERTRRIGTPLPGDLHVGSPRSGARLRPQGAGSMNARREIARRMSEAAAALLDSLDAEQRGARRMVVPG